MVEGEHDIHKTGKKRTHRDALPLLLALPLAVAGLVRALDRRRCDASALLSTDLPAEEFEAVSSDGTVLRVRSYGQGDRTIFFVHGWTCNESIFRFQQEHFGDRYRVVTFDQRGHGRSEIPASLDYHPERQAEDLRAVVDVINPGSFVVAGHSMGGFASFKFYERFGAEYSGRLKGMAIIDSTGTDLVEGIVFGKLIRRIPPVILDRSLVALGRRNRLAQAALRLLRDTSAAYMIVRWAAFGSRPVGAQVEHLREMVTDTPVTSVALAAKACLDFHCDYYLPDIRVPVLLLVGDRDKLTDLKSNEKTARLIPDARLKVFPGAGHCTLLERREEFNRELDGFMSEVLATPMAP